MDSGTRTGQFKNLQSVLRVSPEPHQIITESEVHRLLSDRPLEYLHFMLDQLQDIAAGRMQLELPPKQIFTDPGSSGDFRVMPCITRHGSLTTKTVKLVGTNLQQHIVPDQITVGRAFALDPVENFITHTFEACLLSSARTGLCAALSRALLAQDKDSVGIIGAGRVGWYAGYYVCAHRAPSHVWINDCDPHRAQTLAGQLQACFPDIPVNAADPAAARTADTLILATTSRTALLRPQDTRAKLIISLGADTDDQSELTEDWPATAQVYVDTMDTARFGDLRRWMDKRLLETGTVTDLFSHLKNGDNQCTRSNSTPRVFISTGSALFDNLTIAYLLMRLRGH